MEHVTIATVAEKSPDFRVGAAVLYTVYGPPEHADKTVHKTKEQAERAEAAERTSHRARSQADEPSGS